MHTATSIRVIGIKINCTTKIIMDNIQRHFYELKEYAEQECSNQGVNVYWNSQIAALGYLLNGNLQTVAFNRFGVDGLGEDEELAARGYHQHSEEIFLDLINNDQNAISHWLIYTKKAPCGPGYENLITGRSLAGHDCMGRLMTATKNPGSPNIWIGFELPYAGYPGQLAQGAGATVDNLWTSWTDLLARRGALGQTSEKTKFWNMKTESWMAQSGAGGIENTPTTFIVNDTGTGVLDVANRYYD